MKNGLSVEVKNKQIFHISEICRFIFQRVELALLGLPTCTISIPFIYLTFIWLLQSVLDILLVIQKRI